MILRAIILLVAFVTGFSASFIALSSAADATWISYPVSLLSS